MIIILGYDIGLGWYEALAMGIDKMSVDVVRIWSWAGTSLLAVHVWQRWRLTWSYFKPNRRKTREKAI
ncbi:MAG: hypothetical protein ABIE43_04715 [Patescibacteria group bacterium]